MLWYDSVGFWIDCNALIKWKSSWLRTRMLNCVYHVHGCHNRLNNCKQTEKIVTIVVTNTADSTLRVRFVQWKLFIFKNFNFNCKCVLRQNWFEHIIKYFKRVQRYKRQTKSLVKWRSVEALVINVTKMVNKNNLNYKFNSIKLINFYFLVHILKLTLVTKIQIHFWSTI